MPDTNQVLGRLAGREAASLVGLGIDGTARGDKHAALGRIINELKAAHPQAIYERLIKHLQGSDLTINFQAFKFFNTKPGGAGYVSQFEGGNRWGDGTYVTKRDTAEEAMFDYSGARARPASVPGAVLDRVKHLGMLARDTFEPSARPKYAALNYARLKYGAAGLWGKSFMVLKEHVKHNATYLHSDSFDQLKDAAKAAALPGKVTTFFDMDRLLLNMPSAMLRALSHAEKGGTFGDATVLDGLEASDYIEAQVHGEVRFDRDIARIVICAAEVADAQAKTQRLAATGSFKVVTPKKLRETFMKFGHKFGIPVVEK